MARMPQPATLTRPELPVTLAADAAELERLFRRPPDDSRIMMRWWWFGPCASEAEIVRELETMRAGGIGGVEVAVVYPQGVDESTNGFRNYPYLGPEFLDRIGFASRTARKLGLRFDVTIGSGWSYGGPYIGPDLAAACLRTERREVAPSEATVARPVPWQGERLLAAYAGEGSRQEMPVDWEMLDLSGEGALSLPPSAGPRVLLFIFASHTGQVVKRAAIGAEGYVMDHMRRDATELHLRENGERIMGAVEPGSVTAVFCDSLEVYEANWSEALFAEIERRYGYDPRPLLPWLEVEAGARSDRFRRDYYRTMTALYEANFMLPMREWAERHGVHFRIQNYGQPPAALSSHRQAHLVEGEGWGWRTLAETRWAASAAHLMDLPVASAETWTWIHSPAFRATPLDMKGEAHEHFLLGINQLIGHGWPYSPPEAGRPGWMLYAAGALTDANPWWPVMPELTGYLQRLSSMLRQGEYVADVALYAPTEDAYAAFKPGDSSLYLNLWKMTRQLIGPDIIPAILGSGLNYDLIDDGMLDLAEKRGYGIVVLPNVKYLPEASRRWLDAFIAGGGTVLAVGRRPEGWAEVELVEPGALAARLAGALTPDLRVTPPTPDIGFVHRHMADADLYFIANTGSLPRSVTVQPRASRVALERWDAMTGTIEALGRGEEAISIELAPYAATLLVLRDAPAGAGQAQGAAASLVLAELATGWRFGFEPTGERHPVDLPHDWAATASGAHISAAGRYVLAVEIAAQRLMQGGRILLDFGEAEPIARERQADGTLRGNSYAALINTPIREAATVLVNGQSAGHLWAPPYRLDITDFLTPGPNALEIVVYNTAINRLSEGGHLPDTAAVKRRYGQRARLQDLDNLKPLPSGLLTVPHLVWRP